MYVSLFGFQTAMVLEKHDKFSKEPRLWKVPMELSDQSISDLPGRKLSYFGYEFEVPWNDLNEEKTKQLKGRESVAFSSGKVFFFHTISRKDEEVQPGGTNSELSFSEYA